MGHALKISHPGYSQPDKSPILSVMSSGDISSQNAVRMLYESGIFDTCMLNLKWG